LANSPGQDRSEELEMPRMGWYRLGWVGQGKGTIDWQLGSWTRPKVVSWAVGQVRVPHTHTFAHLACKLVAGHEARQKASNWPTSVSV